MKAKVNQKWKMFEVIKIKPETMWSNYEQVIF